MRNSIPFDLGLEHKSDDEEKTQEGLLSTIVKIEKLVFKKRARAGRSVRVKRFSLLRGVLTVHDDLPRELAQGLFAKPGSYEATIRLSTIPGDPLPDTVSVPRGFAVKIAGVKGELLPETKNHQVQDFLFATGRAFSAPSPRKFLHSLRLLALTTERMLWMKTTMSRVFRPIQKVATRFGHPVTPLDVLGGHVPTHPLGVCFFTQAPIRFGRYLAKLGIFPESENFQAFSEKMLNVDSDPNALRNAVTDVMRQEGGSWTLRAQLRRDEEMNPIENASVVWPEENNPYLIVATLTVPAQEGWSEALSRAIDDAIYFAPSHGLVEHQPLGAVMRARRRVYIFPPWMTHPKKPRKAAAKPKKAPEATLETAEKAVKKENPAVKVASKKKGASATRSPAKAAPKKAVKAPVKTASARQKSTARPAAKTPVKATAKSPSKATRKAPKPAPRPRSPAKAAPAKVAKARAGHD